MRYLYFVIGFFLVASQVFIAIINRYPPTIEQLLFVNLLTKTITTSWILLWTLRLLTLVTMILSLRIYFLLLCKLTKNRDVAYVSSLIILASPLFFSTWYLYPTYAVFSLLALVILFFVANKKGLIMVCILSIFFNLVIKQSHPKFFEAFNASVMTSQVTDRFQNEDSITEKIAIPLWFKRLSYNKYYFSYKTIINEVLQFPDLETWFFDEVHPLSQKSMVMFYWPELLLAVYGGAVILRNNQFLAKKLGMYLLVGFVFFVFSNDLQASYRQYLSWWFLSVVIGVGIVSISSYAFMKYIYSLVMAILFLSVLFNYYDLVKRQDFWFDNRPIAYGYLFPTIKTVNYKSTVYMTSLIGHAAEYCKFYYGVCPAYYNFDGFNISKKPLARNGIYAGFIGEFAGTRMENNFNDSDIKMIISNVKVVGIYKLRDSIAYLYGENIVVGVKE